MLNERMTPIEAMARALYPLWALSQRPASELLHDSAFQALERFCETNYPSAIARIGRAFALADALRALGIPAGAEDSVCLTSAAAALVEALTATRATVRYLCPLNLADTMPTMKFGAARIELFGRDELHDLLDVTRLRRLHPRQQIALSRLCQFHWLVVEDTQPVRSTISARAYPFFEEMVRDFWTVDPHADKHPSAVNDALFALLLVPWEDLHSDHSGDWRGFNIPWTHTNTDDLFAAPRPLPADDTLSWQPHIFECDGEEVEEERPITIDLWESAQADLSALDHHRWDQLQAAQLSNLFSTPIKHFMLRAFFSSGIDEIIAHLTAVEAALGMHADFKGPRPAHIAQRPAKKRLMMRIEALTGDRSLVADYDDLFELRSGFIHGRAIDGKIPGHERMRARRISRRVTEALVKQALGLPTSVDRTNFLWSLA
jgi:hypothetical protein